MKAIKGLTRIVIFSMIGTFLLSSVMLYSLASGDGTPVVPHNFYGTLMIDGSPAPSGTLVQGKVLGVDKTYPLGYNTTSQGQYGSTTLDGKFGVDCTYGDQIDFYVAGHKAEQTASCDPGADTNLALTVSISGCTPSQEVCDGLDNDCDAQVDEDFPNLGQACLAGLGVCQTAGVYICSESGLSTVCSAVAGQPTGQDNDCNGVDENCDGLVDNNYVPTPSSCGVGACASSGQIICSGGQLTDTCLPGTPGTEVCDNQIDDDCDGQTDEDCTCTNGQTQACPLQAGVCSGSFQTCTDNQWPGCTAANYGQDYQSVETSCDGLDNDCDGPVDEGLKTTYYQDSDQDGFGSLVSQSACTQPPGYVTNSLDCNDADASVHPGAAELCNGVDDNCDTQTDEGCYEQPIYCLQITGMRVLNSVQQEDYTIPAGSMYYIEMSTYNDCAYDVQSMQIIQVLKGLMPVNLGSLESTIHPAETSVIKAGFIMQQGTSPGTGFTAKGFNWNHWIDQDPPSFEILSGTSQVAFQSE